MRKDRGVTQLHDLSSRGFASDNYSGVHPEILEAIGRANGAHQISYGEDVYTERLQEVFARHFGEGTEAFPVFNGTGANVIGLQSMLPRWGAVICASTALVILFGSRIYANSLLRMGARVTFREALRG